MFPDLPEHLQALNTIPGNTPPSNVMNQEQEDAFWGFLHADELFRNFGSAPSPPAQEKPLDYTPLTNTTQQLPPPPPVPAPTPFLDTQAQPQSQNQSVNSQTLEAFIASFIGQTNYNNAHTVPAANASGSAVGINAAPTSIPANYLVPFPTPYGTATAPASPRLGPSAMPFDILPASASHFDDEESPDDRISGAKRLKQVGAGQAEIEEDKRRRNTEASARFRAKKKEREQALEVRAKELEGQLAALAAENSSLENENRLLKAIVLNAGPGTPLGNATANFGSTVNANGHRNESAAESLQAALAAFASVNQGQNALSAGAAGNGSKRKRDE